MNRRRSALAGSLLLSMVCVLAGCGGEAESHKSGKIALKTFDSRPCEALSKSAMAEVVESVSVEAGLQSQRTTAVVTRYAGDYSHCKYVLTPKSKELDGTAQSTVTVYNEQTDGGKLMRACHDRSVAKPVPAPAASASSAPRPAPSRSRAVPSAQPSTAAPAATPSAAMPRIGDETCVDALGQVRVRLGDRYFSVVADLAVDPPREVTDRSLTPSEDPSSLNRAELDARNQVVAEAVARAVLKRLGG